MGDLAKVVFEYIPNWGIWVITIVVIITFIGLCATIWWNLAKTYKNDTRKEDILKLKSEKEALKSKLDLDNQEIARFKRVIKNSENFLNKYKELRMRKSTDNSFEIVRQIIEKLEGDLRLNSNNEHRVCYWVADLNENKLKSTFSSISFQATHSEEKKLDINNSIAGRAFRRKVSIVTPDISNDPDGSMGAPKNYISVIAIPIEGFGVLTIDAKEEISEYLTVIAEHYARLIEIIMLEYEEIDLEDMLSQ